MSATDTHAVVDNLASECSEEIKRIVRLAYIQGGIDSLARLERTWLKPQGRIDSTNETPDQLRGITGAA